MFSASRPKCSTENNPRTCAERRHIERLIHIANKKGVPSHNVIRWIRRYEGEFKVNRYLANGEQATSLPCVRCRKALEKYHIKWTAYFDGKWVKWDDEDLPESRPTERQKKQNFKLRS